MRGGGGQPMTFTSCDGNCYVMLLRCCIIDDNNYCKWFLSGSACNCARFPVGWPSCSKSFRNLCRVLVMQCSIMEQNWSTSNCNCSKPSSLIKHMATNQICPIRSNFASMLLYRWKLPSRSSINTICYPNPMHSLHCIPNWIRRGWDWERCRIFPLDCR